VCQLQRKAVYDVTIELSTAIIISVLSLGFSVYMGLKNNKRTDTKDVEERVKENTRINMKLDAISNNTTDIKNEVSEMRKEINSHDNRIIKVEESVKSAHHRIDGIENRLNDDKEV
jgi:predicted nuclease with TOPRIM domain